MRILLLKGGNLVPLLVEIVREHVLYVACHPVVGLKVGKKFFHVQQGAVLVRNTEHDADDREFYMVFNGGIYDAVRSQGTHVPTTIDMEHADVRLLQGSVEWGIQQAWDLARAPDDADAAAYRTRVHDVVRRLYRVRDLDKSKARARAVRAARPTDRLGRVNFPSRALILWSATRALDARVRTTRRIAPRITQRHLELLALADEAWIVKLAVEKEVEASMRIWRDSGVFSWRTAMAMARRLETHAWKLRNVPLAPYGRRGFPRIAEDLSEAARLLRARKYRDAMELVDRSRRALLVMDVRRKIEEMCTVASCLKRARFLPDAAAVRSLEAHIEAAKGLLHENSLPLDRDFRTQVVGKVVKRLEAAREAAVSPAGYRAKDVYRNLKAAAAPL